MRYPNRPARPVLSRSEFPSPAPAVAGLALLLACAPDASADGSRARRILSLGTLGGEFSQARGINDAGVIAGNSAGRPVRWTGGRIEVLALPPGLEGCQATAINNRGWITVFCDGEAGFRAYLWKDGAAVPLAASWNDVVPTGVDGRGQVVGYGWSGPGEHRAFVWSRGRFARLSGFGGWTQANAISENGRIVGQASRGASARALFWDRCGAAVNLGTLPGGDFSSASAVNDAGTVAGVSSGGDVEPGSGGYRAVIWK